MSYAPWAEKLALVVSAVKTPARVTLVWDGPGRGPGVQLPGERNPLVAARPGFEPEHYQPLGWRA